MPGLLGVAVVRGQEEDAAFGEEALEEKGELPEAVGEAFGVAVGGVAGLVRPLRSASTST